ncbi:uncharacterized protein EDB91DRAFT_77834 [Suillus paluster]|uniref:uncharacterized protein n=1 Tax=Suillus paluster TaxID=48578 RepID=UPI001B85C197|nr:uncharacterized protein EDB91DRAFT_77834 [Suillus paluster]KAG1725997.1 hypothetical protein EDB91DRAFT_77834 [Suillus paluster]
MRTVNPQEKCNHRLICTISRLSTIPLQQHHRRLENIRSISKSRSRIELPHIKQRMFLCLVWVRPCDELTKYDIRYYTHLHQAVGVGCSLLILVDVYFLIRNVAFPFTPAQPHSKPIPTSGVSPAQTLSNQASEPPESYENRDQDCAGDHIH